MKVESNNIEKLQNEVDRLDTEYLYAKQKLHDEKRRVPDGYKEIHHGDIVQDGAIAFEPHHMNWHKAGNSVGKILNKDGYISGITHRGYKYANPILITD